MDCFADARNDEVGSLARTRKIRKGALPHIIHKEPEKPTKKPHKAPTPLQTTHIKPQKPTKKAKTPKISKFLDFLLLFN